MNKLLFFIWFLIAGSCQAVKAQSTSLQNSHSQLYLKEVKPADKILFLYRPELFTGKQIDILTNELSKLCHAKNVKIAFAEMSSKDAAELISRSDLICRISSMTMSRNSPGSFSNEYYKNFSILAFVSNDPDMPVWKCNCDRMLERDAAKCIVNHLIADELIK